MYQQYIYQVQTTIAQLSTEELKELLNDDTKLEERVMDVVSEESERALIHTHKNNNNAYHFCDLHVSQSQFQKCDNCYVSRISNTRIHCVRITAQHTRTTYKSTTCVFVCVLKHRNVAVA